MLFFTQRLRDSITPTARTWTPRTITWRLWAAIILIPVFMLSLGLFAFHGTSNHPATAKAAVANNDEPVELNGQTLPLGRQLASELLHNNDSDYDWTLTDADDARNGLDNGSYAITVTIPNDFSKRIVDTMQASLTGDTSSVSNGLVHMETSNTTGVNDPQFARAAAERAKNNLDQLIIRTYLGSVYDGSNTMHESLSTAADGANQLGSGINTLHDGANQLHDATKQLVDGTTTLKQGGSQLESGAQQVAQGAEQVAQGNEQLASTVSPIAQQASSLLEQAPSAVAALQQMQELVGQCAANNTPQAYCDKLDQALSQATEPAERIDAAKAQAIAQIQHAQSSINQLAQGSRQVADGAKSVADGASQLNQGIVQLSDGATAINDGAAQLSDGTKKLQEGADTLSSGLTNGVKQVPTFSKEARERLASTIAQPTRSIISSIPSGLLAATLLMALALWGLSLAVYVIARPISADILTSRESTWKLVATGMFPGTAAASIGALLASAIAWAGLRLDIQHGAFLMIMALVCAMAFNAINQALIGSFGSLGRLLSMMLMALTLLTGIVSTIPAPLASLASMLPTHAANMMLRTAITGSGSITQPLLTLLTWWVVGFLACVALTARRRTLNPNQLRLPSQTF